MTPEALPQNWWGESVYLVGRCWCDTTLELVKRDLRWTWVEWESARPCDHETLTRQLVEAREVRE